MRPPRLVLALAAAGALGLAASLVGCPAAHDGYPTRDCKLDSDCFRGERCVENLCVLPPPDLAVDPSQGYDFSRPDLTEVDGDGTTQDLAGGDL